jgi:ankyrin repeat protein
LDKERETMDAAAQQKLNQQLFSEACEGFARDVERLLAAGADARWQNTQGFTPLMAAICKGRTLRLCELLLPRSDVHAADLSGRTALMHAARQGRDDCVRLLANEETARARDHKGKDALLHAAFDGYVILEAEDGVGRSIEILAPLSDCSNLDDKGMTALMCLSFTRGCADAFRAVLAFSDPNAIDSRGRTALMMAARTNGREAVDLLLPLSDLDLADHGGQTAEDMAVENADSLDDPRSIAFLLRSEKLRRDRDTLLRESENAREALGAPALAGKRPRSL